MKVRLQKDEKGEVSKMYERNPKATAKLRIIVNDLRPGMARPGPSQPELDLIWRKDVKMGDIKTNVDFQRAIAEYLGLDRSTLKFRFCVHTGCKDCGCSPGIIVHVKGEAPNSFAPLIWVSISNDDQDIDALILAQEAKAAGAPAPISEVKAPEVPV